MPLKDHCQPRPSVFAQDRRVTVLNLDTFLKGQINGKEFFEENYFTQGMLTLVDRAFRHLSGKQAGSSIFQLSQAMGGGKTQSTMLQGRKSVTRTENFPKSNKGEGNVKK